MIEREEILHLGSLARIKLTEAEITSFKTTINDIIDYVSVIGDIVGDAAETKQAGAVRNVFRDDEITNQPDEYTNSLLKEMPDTEGKFMKVKKILSQD